MEGTLSRRRAPGRDHAASGRVRVEPHLRRVRVRSRRRAGRRASRCAWRSSFTRTATTAPSRCSSSCCDDPDALPATERYYAEQARRRALADAVAADQPRRRVGQDQHAARDQGVSAGLGLDELAAVGHPGLARHVVVRPRLRLLLAAVLARRDRAVQPLPRAQRPGRRVRARRQRLQDVLRPQRQRRHAAAHHRDPAPLQRDARRRVAARRLSAGAPRSPTTCSPSATRTGWCSARRRASTCSASRRGATSSRTTRSTAR